MSNKKAEASAKNVSNTDKKNKLTKQTIGTLSIGVLAIIALIMGFIINQSANKGTKESKEILDNFYKYMRSSEEKVIYYGSAQCGYCELETPIMKQIKEDYDMDYLYIDASKLTKNEKNEILEALDIKGSTPTIAIVKDDQVIDTNVGYVDGSDMVAFLKENKILKDGATYKPEEHLTFIDFDKYKDLVSKDESSIIVIGQTTCSHCIAVKPVLNHIAGNYDVTINYLNLTEMSSDDQQELIKSLKELGYDDADNFGTPLTIIVKNKHIDTKIEGESPTSYFIKQFKKAGLISEE